MTKAAVFTYFNAYPKLQKCFQTFDGILHPTEDVANSWLKKFGDKKVIVHDRAEFIKEEEAINEAEKIALAKKKVLEGLAELNIPIDEEDLDNAIEEAANKSKGSSEEVIDITKDKIPEDPNVEKGPITNPLTDGTKTGENAETKVDPNLNTGGQ